MGWLLLPLLLVCASCSTPPAALRADTVAYLQKMSSWAPTEAETARTIERILATEFVDQAEVLRQIADSTPRVQRQLEDAQRYEPRTSEVRRIHSTYVGAWHALLGGYQSIQSGLETSDQPKLAQGRLAMARWRDGSRGGARPAGVARSSGPRARRGHLELRVFAGPGSENGKSLTRRRTGQAPPR